MRLILIRHGETPSNVAGALDTAIPGAPLTPLGHRQADAIPAALADEAITAVHASPLVRTQLTATPLATARGLEIVVSDGLEEIGAGELEMRTDQLSISSYASTVTAWIAGDLAVPMPGGPDGHSFFNRYDAAVGAIAAGHADDATVVAVSHGAAIRTFAARHGGPREERLLNTGAVVLDGDPSSGWTVARWSRDPLGGAHLVDEQALDPTGDPDPV
ncbi:histidine phosphatase [Nocardioides sp. Root1257]|uniref:histidine phosphatase family protein n=1 Tax=unclassified Nocardioides TaxID=2615069 RepID=UPI0007001D7B|nr:MULTISPECIES: histidine phosphatase family protein [unclassified Nocardioides]KQW47116.1 histidine phosphatase [Nocardioides sp. Root1257]KRC43861.1 histidine phosphatase [Nocardioides sp. Root224]